MKRNKSLKIAAESKLLNTGIRRIIRTLLFSSLYRPKLFYTLLNQCRHQKKAAQRRLYWHINNYQVPPILIISITSTCNLRCAGCYSKILHKGTPDSLTPERFRNLLLEANQLGISIIMLAGGEPLMRKDLLEEASRHKNIIFPVFTNGLLIDKEWTTFFDKNKHIVPLLSIEGEKSHTDERRGEGIHDKLEKIITRLHSKNILWGTSITLSTLNFKTIIKTKFIQSLITERCRLFFFVEYVPIDDNSSHLVLSRTQREVLIHKLDEYRKQFPALFLTFPNDEEKFGGCLAAGRGFLHINHAGKVEPCPFAPFSDLEIVAHSLKDALKSPFLNSIRENHNQLTESEGGCALWANRDWVKTLYNNLQ